MAADGFGERDDEAEEVLAGIGVVEVADVVGGVDTFGWGLEMVGFGCDWDLLGLWDGCEDDGSLGVEVWGDCWGADGAVGGWRGDFGEGRGGWRRGEGGGAAALAACAGGCRNILWC